MLDDLHPALRRLMLQSGVSPDRPPSAEAWAALLGALNSHLGERERDRDRSDHRISLVVHDLKGPLGAVLCNAAMLAEATTIVPDDRAAIDDIHTAASAVLRMGQDLLDLGRSDTGVLPRRDDDVELAGLIAGIVRTMRGQGEARRVRIVTELVTAEVRGDGAMLGRVIENLIDNALRFAPAGTEVRVATAHVDEAVVLRIHDHGMIVPASERHRVFDKNVRLADRVRLRGGRGLGLAFCRVVVEAHGGTIAVDAAPEGGSVFCVRIPRIVEHDRSPASPSSTGARVATMVGR